MNKFSDELQTTIREYSEDIEDLKVCEVFVNDNLYKCNINILKDSYYDEVRGGIMSLC